MTTWEFAATGPVQAEIKLPAGSVNVSAAKTTAVTVELLPANRFAERVLGETEVSFEAGRLTVRVPERGRLSNYPSLDLRVTLPEGSWYMADPPTPSLHPAGEMDYGVATGRERGGGFV
jgi:hypothetical protein